MKKKRSPKEIIESVRDPHLESGYLKFKGEDMFQADSDRNRTSVKYDLDILENNAEKKKEGYSNIHTHPGQTILPSNKDLVKFLSDDELKNMWIAQTDERTGKVRGYLILKKTKKSPSFRDLKNKKRSAFLANDELVRKVLHAPPNKSYNENYPRYYAKLNSLADSFRFKYRFIPASGYELSDDKANFIKIEKGFQNIDLFLPVGIISLIFSLFFISLRVTGFTIAALSVKNANFIGAIFFVLGLFSFYLYFNKQ